MEMKRKTSFSQPPQSYLHSLYNTCFLTTIAADYYFYRLIKILTDAGFEPAAFSSGGEGYVSF